MIKKLLLTILALSISISLIACKNVKNEVQDEMIEQNNNEIPSEVDIDKLAITQLVKDFGSKLQNVSLLSPTDILQKSIKENYGDYLSQNLLNDWLEDPSIAIGRLTSSPWPDRIEVISIEKQLENSYIVKGEVIEITSVEMENNGVAARQSIELVVNKVQGNWVIDSISTNQYDSEVVIYENKEFGFNFSLPLSWKVYIIVTDKWEGLPIGDSEAIKDTETGPIVIIRHPLWTSDKPYQDIPIMIFTHEQWDLIQDEKLSLGAAPIGPKELGRNDNYIFALPARYNYAFLLGYEEVENILESNPLKPIS